MPGPRLQIHERHQIESAINEGRSYAEIARRLARPTSTITREVNRNGGHNHYRATRAHDQAAHRARRAATSRHSPSPLTTGEHHEDPSTRTREAIARRLATMMTTAGMPAMMAKVLVALLLSDTGAATAGELIAGLQVSPASISKSVRNLEHLQFVRREPLPASRRERYVLDQDMWSGIWTARTEAMLTWGTAIRDAVDQLGVTTPAGARLEQMSRFLTFLHHEMRRATHRWHEQATHQELPSTDTR